jgi:hypothetical protein
MVSSPLRAIVLDNDEATGSYLLVFDIWMTLAHTSLGNQLKFQQVIDFFVEHWKSYNLFRPGFFKFLKTCVELREAGRIDAIIMYTHQNADFTWSGWSVPAFLSVLMGHIVAQEFPEGKLKRTLFDHVLTLPPTEFQKKVDGWVVKDFDRILNLYPWKPRDIRQIIFVDDHATPKHIEAETISAEAKGWNSWYKVAPYRVEHGPDRYMNAIRKLIEIYDLNVDPKDYGSIDDISNEYVREISNSTYYPDDRTFLDLETHVRDKFRGISAPPVHKKWRLW